MMSRKKRILNAADEYAALVRMAGEAFEREQRLYTQFIAAEKESNSLRKRLVEAQTRLTAATAPRGAGVHDQGGCCTPETPR